MDDPDKPRKILLPKHLVDRYRALGYAGNNLTSPLDVSWIFREQADEVRKSLFDSLKNRNYKEIFCYLCRQTHLTKVTQIDENTIHYTCPDAQDGEMLILAREID